jgi:tetratricopeptide (TPR) repeat protein
MKKYFNSLAVCVVVMNFLAACTTTHEAAAQAASSAETGNLPAAHEVQSSEVPANIEFARNLEKTLADGTPGDALALFDTMPDSLKNDKNLEILKASLLVSAGRVKEAAALGNSLLAGNERNIDVLELNAMIAKALGDSTGQSVYIKKILEIDPYNSEANIVLAQDEMMKHGYRNALIYYQRSLARAPENEEGLSGAGQASYYLGQLDDAKTAFEKILAKNSHNAFALAYMGKLAAEDENYKQALDYVTQAIKYDADNYNYYLDLGTYSRRCGKFDDAEAAWTKAITLDPSYFLAYAYRAGLYDELNKLDQALQDYKKVIETNPKYYFAYESLGMLAWHAGDYDESRRAFDLARSVTPDNISYTLMIAATYLKQNKKNECKTFLETVMKKMDRESLDYMMVRLYHDGGGINAENDAVLRVRKEDNSNKRGKMLYYLGLFYELKNSSQLAMDFYTDVLKMNSPMFFEYRLAEWEIKK